jgi:hypothetical protein
MSGEVSIRPTAVRIEVAILEATFTLGEHPKRFGLVGLDCNDGLFEHGFRLGRRPILRRDGGTDRSEKGHC